MLLNILAYELHNIRKPRIDHEDIFNAVTQVNSRCRGGYAVVAMVPGMSLYNQTNYAEMWSIGGMAVLAHLPALAKTGC